MEEGGARMAEMEDSGGRRCVYGDGAVEIRRWRIVVDRELWFVHNGDGDGDMICSIDIGKEKADSSMPSLEIGHTRDLREIKVFTLDKTTSSTSSTRVWDELY
ncbi:hypothetical protein LguiA_024008 [Lonicera macranthoides]